MTKDEPFSKLIDLFEAIDITEKGIEKVYDYLLRNHIIDDPKEIAKKLNLALKRIYKIIGVLKSLELIQTYDRPMKAVINPPIQKWETIITNKINEIQATTSKKLIFVRSLSIK